jgi:hypothetical protein
MKSLYDFPEIYELVLARAPGVIESEVASIQQLLAQRNMQQARILELACGACAHGLLLAQAGCHVTGVDRAPAMLQMAEQRAAVAGIQLDLFQGDIIDFDLTSAPFDAIIFMYETFPVITEYAALVQHFAAVRRHIKPHGLYIIDLDARKHGVGIASGEWGRRTLTVAQGTVETWNEDLPGDWVAGTSHMILHCRITLDGITQPTRDDWRLRVYSPWDLRVLLKTIAGWQLDGFYTWNELQQTIAGEDHYFMVLEAT